MGIILGLNKILMNDSFCECSLFYVVVDTDDTATTLLEQLTREKSGRVTFIPLNQLTAKEISYPNTGTARPLTDILSYDKPTLHKAFVQV
jgi:structural maintenance of chromosome 3 (chondroitin sulfate proteoglycan 6)